MKKLFFAISIATMMGSCSNDETIDVVASQPIVFGNAFVENSTRADVEDGTYSGNKLPEKFKVYGTVEGNHNLVNIFSGADVEKKVNGWECGTIQYWVPNCTYNFMALVDATEGGNSVVVDGTGMPTSITYNVESQKDLLIATANREQKDKELDDSEVAFTFSHLLSKVQFEFTNHFPENSGVELKVKDLKITNAPETGTYTIGSNNSWTSVSGTAEIEFGKTEYFSTVSGTGITEPTPSEYARVLIPGTYTFDISFLVEHNKGGSDTEKTFTTGVVTLEPGKSYNFTATLNANNVSGVQPITFNIREDDNWDSQDKNVDY